MTVTYAADTFTRADGAIGTAETGGAYAIEAPAAVFSIVSNKAKSTVTSVATEDSATLDIGQADCTITVDFTYATTSNGGICFRHQDFANTNILVGYSNKFEFYTVTASTYALVGSSATVSWVNGNTYQMKLVLSGTSWIASVDGVEQINTTSSHLQSATKHGIRAAETVSIFDNLLITDGAAAPGGQPVPIISRF